MDILTHLMIGAAATSPFWASHPLESVAFTFGSVIPDIDAMSRQFGKVAYLQAHQGWTHAIPVQLGLTVIGISAVAVADYAIFIPSIIAFGAAAVLHVLLDWTNTWGVRLLAPFDRRRHSLEWVFFIDLFVIATTLTTLALQAYLFSSSGGGSGLIAAGWGVTLIVYIAGRGWLRWRADRVAPAATSLLPSAAVPWRFYGIAHAGDTVETFTLNAVTGSRSRRMIYRVLDGTGAQRLERLPEFRAMRELSSGYHIVSEEGGVTTCRDLRTRNFGTNFGRLLIRSSGDTLTVERFDV